MHSRTNHTLIKSRRKEFHCFNTPVECIRKTRSLNLDGRSCCVSREVYKILKSNNGRKIFIPYHRTPWA